MGQDVRNSSEDFSLELPGVGQTERNNIDESYREDALRLCRMQGLDVDTREILFVTDKSGQIRDEPMSLVAISPMMSDILFQLTGYYFRFVFKIWDGVMQRLGGEAQFAAYMYHTLKFLKRDEKTNAMTLAPRPDVQEWFCLLPYVREGRYDGIPNMLDMPLVSLNEEEQTDDRETQSK